MFHEQPIDTYIVPPLLTHIDSLKQTNIEYEIESHIESWMYDAAIEITKIQLSHVRIEKMYR
jgi:hypothetical protein